MTDETTTNPVVIAGDLITGPGLYEARCGHIVPITGWEDGWWVSYCDGVLDWFSSDGLQRCRANTDVGQWDLVRWVGPLPASEPQPETTSEQLAEIEGQAESTPVTEYTPPEGWRVLAVGEELREGDVRVDDSGACSAVLVTVNGVVPHGRRYTRPIEQQPQPESDTELQAQVAFLKNREVTLGTRLQQEREVTTRLRHELKTVQNQLAAVKAELASVAADRQRLRVELDAVQQVPADSPELRQLRADLEQVTLGRDTYRDGYERVLSDLKTIRETAKAEAVEAIAEWLEPIRLVDSAYLANATMQHLPQIMRHLTGLDSHAID